VRSFRFRILINRLLHAANCGPSKQDACLERRSATLAYSFPTRESKKYTTRIVLSFSIRTLFYGHLTSPFSPRLALLFFIYIQDFKRGIGSLNCRLCAASYQMPIHHLHEPVDVFSEWLDDCEAAANPNRQQHDDVGGGGAGASAAAAGGRYDDDDDDDLDDDLPPESGLGSSKPSAKGGDSKKKSSASPQRQSHTEFIDDSDDDDDD